MRFDERLSFYVNGVEEALSRLFPERPELSHAVLFKALRYSVLAGGKRLRPVLLLEFHRICGGAFTAALPFACAIEAVHTYSLIHDDLPCMDNDDFRRGKPTSHRVFGEAVAVLAGDGLLNAAFEIMLASGDNATLPADRVVRAAHEIAVCAGARGMIGGQVIDITSENTAISADQLKDMYALKTGALISAACKAGCILAGADEKLIGAAGHYALSLGLAFQIVDDILDIRGNSELTGKSVGSDRSNMKLTYPALVGVDESYNLVKALTAEATDALLPFHDTDFLRELAASLIDRDR